MKLSRLLLAALVLSTPLHAEEKTKTPAERLVEVYDLNAATMTTAKQAFQPVLDRFKAQGLPKAAIDEISDAADLFFSKTFSDPELKRSLVKLYQQKFTEGELNELLRFYETPVGKKSLAVMPELMTESSKIGQKLAEKNAPEFQKQIQDILAKYKDQGAEEAPEKEEKEEKDQ